MSCAYIPNRLLGIEVAPVLPGAPNAQRAPITYHTHPHSKCRTRWPPRSCAIQIPHPKVFLSPPTKGLGRAAFPDAPLEALRDTAISDAPVCRIDLVPSFPANVSLHIFGPSPPPPMSVHRSSLRFLPRSLLTPCEARSLQFRLSFDDGMEIAYCNLTEGLASDSCCLLPSRQQWLILASSVT